MPEAQITNPTSAFRTVTSFINGVAADGSALVYEQVVVPYRANAAVVKGDALMFVAPTATVPLSVAQLTNADGGTDPWRFAGVALEAAAAAGEVILVLRKGFGVVKFDAAGTPAAYDVLLLPGAAAGAFKTAAGPAVGEAIAGVVYGAEIGTSNTCFAYVGADVPTETTA